MNPAHFSTFNASSHAGDIAVGKMPGAGIFPYGNPVPVIGVEQGPVLRILLVVSDTYSVADS